jgi:hypothetical protein
MTALTKDRATLERDGSLVNYAAAASKKFFAGSLACINASGYLTPGATATTLKAAGRVEAYADTTGLSAGDVKVLVRRGCFKFANAGDIVIADTLGTAYIVDDQTVAGDDGTGTRSVAGKIIEVESDGVWVEII